MLDNLPTVHPTRKLPFPPPKPHSQLRRPPKRSPFPFPRPPPAPPPLPPPPHSPPAPPRHRQLSGRLLLEPIRKFLQTGPKSSTPPPPHPSSRNTYSHPGEGCRAAARQTIPPSPPSPTPLSRTMKESIGKHTPPIGAKGRKTRVPTPRSFFRRPLRRLNGDYGRTRRRHKELERLTGEHVGSGVGGEEGPSPAGGGGGGGENTDAHLQPTWSFLRTAIPNAKTPAHVATHLT
ncbi:hypothetical protein J437_LFUL005991 [Ladona fulva]|uniref:Uncharacterized protein n=1 Tax=Ladona fulva TaxID=123851 RepID=A0A8K0JYF1_LADFU|nr:hypothetical protein J437_LFUL005991 [Ladona fulva]